MSYDEKLQRWSGHEYLIDVDGHVWMIDYDNRELSLVKSTPGTIVLENGANIRHLKIPTAIWMVKFRNIKVGYVEPQSQIINFEYM